MTLALAGAVLATAAIYLTLRGVREESPALQFAGILVEMGAAAAIVLTIINPWKKRG